MYIYMYLNCHGFDCLFIFKHVINHEIYSLMLQVHLFYRYRFCIYGHFFGTVKICVEASNTDTGSIKKKGKICSHLFDDTKVSPISLNENNVRVLDICMLTCKYG